MVQLLATATLRPPAPWTLRSWLQRRWRPKAHESARRPSGSAPCQTTGGWQEPMRAFSPENAGNWQTDCDDCDCCDSLLVISVLIHLVGNDHRAGLWESLGIPMSTNQCFTNPWRSVRQVVITKEPSLSWIDMLIHSGTNWAPQGTVSLGEPRTLVRQESYPDTIVDLYVKLDRE